MNDFATLFLPRSIPYCREKLVMSRSGECYLFRVFSNDPDTIWLVNGGQQLRSSQLTSEEGSP